MIIAFTGALTGIRAEFRYQKELRPAITLILSPADPDEGVRYYPFGPSSSRCSTLSAGMLEIPFTLSIVNDSLRPISIVKIQGIASSDDWLLANWTQPLGNRILKAGMNPPLSRRDEPDSQVEIPFFLTQAEPLTLEFQVGWPLSCEAKAVLGEHDKKDVPLSDVQDELYASGTSFGRAEVIPEKLNWQCYGNDCFVAGGVDATGTEPSKVVLLVTVTTSEGYEFAASYSFEQDLTMIQPPPSRIPLHTGGRRPYK